MVNDAVLQKLIQVAKAKSTIQFVELGKVADMVLDNDGDIAALGHILDAIAEEDVAAGRPLLPVLVVHGTRNMPGIGFAMGMERLALLLSLQNQGTGQEAATDLFVAALGEEAALKAFPLVHLLRRKGVQVAMDLEGKSLKSQMKQADRAKARFALILGEEELAKGEAVLRDMASKEQQQLPLTGTQEALCAMLIEAVAQR